VTSSLIQDSLALDLALSALEGDGSLKVLSNPELVVRAPGEAELFAGGEIPIRTRSQFSSNVNWKAFGLTLKLKVAQSSGERVRLEIFTEVSHLDSAISQGDIPGVQANRMKTEVDARYGTPLLLSGLLQQNMREQLKGLPVLRRIPIFGALFGSEDYVRERSELVAILLPASAPPSHAMGRLARSTPRGLVPPPRHWLSPDYERSLRASENWPWNALQ
jgi:Flp pilus assembly secretin CpaC